MERACRSGNRGEPLSHRKANLNDVSDFNINHSFRLSNGYTGNKPKTREITRPQPPYRLIRRIWRDTGESAGDAEQFLYVWKIKNMEAIKDIIIGVSGFGILFFVIFAIASVYYRHFDTEEERFRFIIWIALAVLFALTLLGQAQQ